MAGATGKARLTQAREADWGGVDERLPTPLYHQIYLILRDKIYGGNYADDTRLPGEQELARAFGVSRITAKRALDDLAAAGLAVRERGRGTRARFKAPMPPIRSQAEGLFENLLMMGLKTEVRLLEFEYTGASKEVARALKCQAGEEVQRAIRVRQLDSAPFSHLTTFVPAAIGRSYTRGDLAARPLLALLERGGVVASSAEQTITATLADSKIGPLLDVEVGSPLLRITRIVSDDRDRPVEFITALYRPDRYQYRMMLSRVQAGNRNTWSPAGSDAGPRKTSPQHRARNREKSK